MNNFKTASSNNFIIPKKKNPFEQLMQDNRNKALQEKQSESVTRKKNMYRRDKTLQNAFIVTR